MVQPSVPGVRFPPVRHGANPPTLWLGAELRNLRRDWLLVERLRGRTWLELAGRGLPGPRAAVVHPLLKRLGPGEFEGVRRVGCGVPVAQRSGVVGDAWTGADIAVHQPTLSRLSEPSCCSGNDDRLA